VGFNRGVVLLPVDLPLLPDRRKPDRNLFRICGDQRGRLYIATEQGTLLRSMGNSRLACQILETDGLDGLVVRVRHASL
jgi:hypothetical protein